MTTALHLFPSASFRQPGLPSSLRQTASALRQRFGDEFVWGGRAAFLGDLLRGLSRTDSGQTTDD
jgi:hypothetical protein